MKKLTFGAHYNFVLNHPQKRFLQERKTQWEREYLNRRTKMNGYRGYPAKSHCMDEVDKDAERKFGAFKLCIHQSFDLWGQWGKVNRDESDYFVTIRCDYDPGRLTKIQVEAWVDNHNIARDCLYPNNGMEINAENVVLLARRWCNKNMFLENTKYRRGLLISHGDKEWLKKLLILAWRPQKTIVDEETILRCIRRKYNITGCMYLDDLARWGREHGRQKTLKKLAEFRLDYVYDYIDGEEDEDSIQDALDAYYQDMEGYTLV